MEGDGDGDVSGLNRVGTENDEGCCELSAGDDNDGRRDIDIDGRSLHESFMQPGRCGRAALSPVHESPEPILMGISASTVLKRPSKRTWTCK